jgi:hypothetical protein
MARTKLGLSSSLEAARLLKASEGYQQTGSQASDLDPNPITGDKPASRSTIIGVLAMSLFLAAAMTLLLAQPFSEGATVSADQSPAPSPQDEAPEGNATIKVALGDLGNVQASPERVRRYVRQLFDHEDKDRSGHIERDEAPSRIEMAESRSPASPPQSYSEANIVKVFEGDAARTEYLRSLDIDGDGRISFEEYSERIVPHYEQRGIPLIPADWAACC